MAPNARLRPTAKDPAENGRRSRKNGVIPGYANGSGSRAVPEHPEVRLSARLARFMSMSVAVVGIVVTAPLMVVIAILIKLTSPGPVFYVQDRVGVDRRSDRPPPPESRRLANKGGRIFTIYKFRTMHVGSDGLGEVWASPNDDRVTPIGRFLRSARLDELPQLFNVLLGDMNIVGPRPEQPEIFKDLRGKIDRYPERQRVLPGITGLAQVNQAPDQTLADVEGKVEYDLAYIERKGPIHDLWIMVKTLPVVIKRLGW